MGKTKRTATRRHATTRKAAATATDHTTPAPTCAEKLPAGWSISHREAVRVILLRHGMDTAEAAAALEALEQRGDD